MVHYWTGQTLYGTTGVEEIQTSPKFTCNPDLNQAHFFTCARLNLG